MRNRAFSIRLWILSLIILFGFALRLYNLIIPDLNLDESWSYINSLYLAYPSNTSVLQILGPEPNNALHLVLASVMLSFVPSPFGIRWLSVMIGVITIALTSRIAFRLYGKQASLIAGLITACAYAPVTYSQIARPYALATLLALLSLLFWIERRSRLNMMASILVPLAHIGAMPIVIVQDILTLWRLRSGIHVNKIDWIIRRIPVYTIFFAVLYLVYVRRNFHVISKGQLPPSPLDLLYYTLNLLVNGFPALTTATILFVVGVLLPLTLLMISRRRHLPKNLIPPLLWIACSYGLLIAGAVLSDGPIKWIHISYVAIALALFMATLLTQASSRLRSGILAIFCIASLLSLGDFYAQPDQYWHQTLAEINTLRQANEMIYLQQSTILWAFQINDPSASYVQLLPDESTRPARYLYIEMTSWLPPAPLECDPAPIWTDSGGLRMLVCIHG
ncbi:MAG: hypothetical protein GC204_10730 [Chloroflexi bacterium]|nr:hypothetical protein [Chloroflexota bacterium]